MRTEVTHTPAYASAFCCPACWQLLSLEENEAWTLLRGHQLRRVRFLCSECGYEYLYVQQEADDDNSP